MAPSRWKCAFLPRAKEGVANRNPPPCVFPSSYLKPTDFKRKKKLVLVTERPHYLYVTLTLSEN